MCLQVWKHNLQKQNIIHIFFIMPPAKIEYLEVKLVKFHSFTAKGTETFG